MTKNVNLPELETSRLVLRTYLPEDIDALLEIWRDPDLTKYFPPDFRERDQNERHKYVAHVTNLWQSRGFSQWGIVSKDEGKLIGYCGLQPLGNTQDVELYYGLTRRVWRQGLATEAARAAVRYGFEEVNLPRITALTFPQNIASQKVLEKLGFEHGGAQIFYQKEVFYFEISRQEYERVKDESFYRLRRRDGEAS
ncbi:MAG: GNAT family N-acetyltransferase [Pyrinomonadaceae bacterium]